MAQKKSKNRPQKIYKSQPKHQINDNRLIHWIFYISSLIAFIASCYQLSHKEFSLAVSLIILSLISLFVPFINFSYLRRLDSWNEIHPIKTNLSRDQDIPKVALFFLLYLVVLFWSLLTHPGL